MGNPWRSATRAATVLFPPSGGPPIQLTHFESLRIFRYALSPDDKHVVVSRGTTISDVVLMTSRARSAAAP